MGSEKNLVNLAKLAEQAERYEDMKGAMVEYVENQKADLGTEERNLLSVAFKNVVGHKRTALKILTSISEKEQGERKKEFCKDARLRVEKELEEQCGEVITLLDKKLLPNVKSDSAEQKVFYFKMKGDYLRYLAEAAMASAKENDSSKDHIASADMAYQEAVKIARDGSPGLPSTHPIRLGLALNYSVFFYEILNQPEDACKLAKTAFDDAIAELDAVPEESYKDSTLIMQLLRDNLTLWTSEEAAQVEEDQ